MSSLKMLIVDDEPIVLDYLATKLKRMGYAPITVDRGEKAIELLEKEAFALIITDVKMPGVSGMVVLDHAVRCQPLSPVIILTAHGTIENAVEAMQRGAYHYITKPIDTDLFKLTIERALEKRQLVNENQSLRTQVMQEQGLEALIGSSRAMRDIIDTLKRVTAQPVDVLVSGPSGTGKELVARALHWSSPRSKAPFIKMNCAALPEGLVESELFGHEKGSFTGAVRARKGKFEAANNGTILLDEISEMPLPLQAKLLRVLQEREFERVGSNDSIRVDVRVIATTNRVLAKEVEKGRFRDDLFFRLNVIPISIPPLSQRVEDIPSLVAHFVKKYGSRYGREFEGVESEAIEYLKAQPWQGNVRELENRIERAVVLSRDLLIRKKDVMLDHVALPSSLSSESFGNIPLHELEKRHILNVLREYNYNRTKAADQLGISIRTLRNKLNEYRNQGEDIPKGN